MKPSRTDFTNVKLREIPLDVAPEEQEISLPPGPELEIPELEQREVTTRIAAPETVAEHHHPLDQMAQDYFEHLENVDEYSMPRENLKAVKKNKTEGSPGYRSPHNKPLIDDTPIFALLLSGKLPKRLRKKMDREDEVVTGTIEDIDKKTGVIQLKTTEGYLDLYLMPPAIQDLFAKDEVTLRVRPL